VEGFSENAIGSFIQNTGTSYFIPDKSNKIYNDFPTSFSSAPANIAVDVYSSFSHAIFIAYQHSLRPSIRVSQNSFLFSIHSYLQIRL
jgi:hypothetical protein